MSEQREYDLRLVELLREGARSDLWYDAEEHGDEDALVQIEHTQEAMLEAASRLSDLSDDNETMSRRLAGFYQEPPASERYIAGAFFGTLFMSLFFVF